MEGWCLIRRADYSCTLAGAPCWPVQCPMQDARWLSGGCPEPGARRTAAARAVDALGGVRPLARVVGRDARHYLELFGRDARAAASRRRRARRVRRGRARARARRGGGGGGGRGGGVGAQPSGGQGGSSKESQTPPRRSGASSPRRRCSRPSRRPSSPTRATTEMLAPAFPDAKVVCLHREPVAVATSLCSLLANVWKVVHRVDAPAADVAHGAALLHYVGRDKPWMRYERSRRPDSAADLCRRPQPPTSASDHCRRPVPPTSWPDLFLRALLFCRRPLLPAYGDSCWCRSVPANGNFPMGFIRLKLKCSNPFKKVSSPE